MPGPKFEWAERNIAQARRQTAGSPSYPPGVAVMGERGRVHPWEEVDPCRRGLAENSSRSPRVAGAAFPRSEDPLCLHPLAPSLEVSPILWRAAVQVDRPWSNPRGEVAVSMVDYLRTWARAVAQHQVDGSSRSTRWQCLRRQLQKAATAIRKGRTSSKVCSWTMTLIRRPVDSLCESRSVSWNVHQAGV